MMHQYEELKILGKKGFRQALTVLPINEKLTIAEDNSTIKEIVPISLNSFYSSLDNYNLFLREIKDILLKHELIEILTKEGDTKRFIRLTPKGVTLKLTLDLIISKYFSNGGLD